MNAPDALAHFIPLLFHIDFGNTTKILRHALRAAQNDAGGESFGFISATTASLLASILFTIVLFYHLAELASLCHSKPANGRVEESLCYSLGLFVSLMV